MSDTQQRIASLVQSNDVVLFMKGTASFPQCGFSGRAIQILKGCGLDGKTIATVKTKAPTVAAKGVRSDALINITGLKPGQKIRVSVKVNIK
jgi:monothiol glutaredoxin